MIVICGIVCMFVLIFAMLVTSEDNGYIRFFGTIMVSVLFMGMGFGIGDEYRLQSAQNHLRKVYNVKEIVMHKNDYIVIPSTGPYKRFKIDVKYVITEVWCQKDWREVRRRIPEGR